MEAKEYGTWTSPIQAETVVEGLVQFRQLELDGDDLYWLELRPEEKGRSVFVKQDGLKELFEAPYNARTTVHEYGGHSGLIHEGILYFVHFADQNLYKVLPGQKPSLVIAAPNKRFADFCMHPNGKWLYAVIEEHGSEIKNSLAKIDVEEKQCTVIASGHDFYAAPRVSPDGNRIAFYSWDNPNMPWDGTDLWLGDLDSKGMIEAEKKIAGGKSESALEPRWAPDGSLYFVSDQSGYWNIYDEENEPVYEMNADFTVAPWLLGPSEYTFLEIDNTPYIAAIITEKAVDSLVLINLKEKLLSRIPLDYTVYSQLKTRKGNLVFIGASPTKNPEIATYDPRTQKLKVLHKSRDVTLGESYISEPKIVAFPTTHGKTAFAFYYPPKNPNFQGNPGELPPLVLFTHGGPTAHVHSGLKWMIQFWTSRGFAVADINYGGSTGYGREYRERLKGSWGTTDVDDASALAHYLVEQKLADPKRLAIRGGSAGGYTVLASLAFRNTFQVGTSLYGVSDLELLLNDTHKFEARYLDSLVGKYPECKQKYQDLSPLHHINNISCPVLLLQGAEDKIVPPEHSEKMYEALLKKKIPTAYLLFDGEQHGFKQSANIIRALEAEFFFYSTIFGIQVDTTIKPIQIANLSVK